MDRTRLPAKSCRSAWSTGVDSRCTFGGRDLPGRRSFRRSARRRRLRRRRSRRPRDRRAIRDRERPRRCGRPDDPLRFALRRRRRDPELQRLEQLRAVIGELRASGSARGGKFWRSAPPCARPRPETAAPALPSRVVASGDPGATLVSATTRAQPGQPGVAKPRVLFSSSGSPSCRWSDSGGSACGRLPAIREGSDCRKEERS